MVHDAHVQRALFLRELADAEERFLANDRPEGSLLAPLTEAPERFLVSNRSAGMRPYTRHYMKKFAIDATQPASTHYALGAHLAPLRDEGVLIIGSGNVVHNLRTIGWGGGEPYDWAVRFNAYVRDAIAARQYDRLIEYENAGPDARLAVPTPEHYLPLLYVLGAQRDDETAHVAIDGLEIKSIGMLSLWVGPH